MRTLIFIDLDGVQVDLMPSIKQFNSRGFDGLTTSQINEIWDRIHREHPTFWKDLPALPYQKTLYNAILEVCESPIVLSATPKPYTDERDDRCREHKTAWVAQHMSHAQSLRTIVTKSNIKQLVIPMFEAERHVLVDDHRSNIKRWVAAGGIGIHHVTLENTLKALKELNT